MALRLTQPLTEMSTRYLPWVKSDRRVWLQPHCHLWADCLENVGSSMSHSPIGLHGLLQGLLYFMQSVNWIDSFETFQSEAESLVQNNSKHTNTNTAIRCLIQAIKHNNQLHDGALSWKIELLSRPRTSTSRIEVKACYLPTKPRHWTLS
jgi:hypothetical protein